MSNILVNGLNAKSGGGKSILNNYLGVLNKKKLYDFYFILTPNKNDYLKYESEKINIIDINSLLKMTFMLPFTYRFGFKSLLAKYKIETIFNIADIPIVTKVNQIFLFDWSYGVYFDSPVWKMMYFRDYFARKIKLICFKKNLKYVNIMIAQNSVIKQRLENLYNISEIKVINNAVSLDNLINKKAYDFKLPKGKKLLYLTRYYQHKNIEIFIPLAKAIKKLELNYKLIITIDKTQGKGARQLLANINRFDLSNIIINVGEVDMVNVPSLYQQCDGLLMPTLLESFSGTYVEAMFHKIPIFTSDIDFARVVCGDAATYFDPFDPDSILNAINKLFNNPENIKNKVIKGSQNLKHFLNWDQAFDKYQNYIKYNHYEK